MKAPAATHRAEGECAAIGTDAAPNSQVRPPAMAPTPWRGRQRCPRLRRPEIRGVDRVALHLEVQGLVVHPQEPRRLTLVATRGAKSQAYRLSLRLGGGAAGQLLQCEARLLSSPATRSRVFTRGHGSPARNSQT